MIHEFIFLNNEHASPLHESMEGLNSILMDFFESSDLDIIFHGKQSDTKPPRVAIRSQNYEKGLSALNFWLENKQTNWQRVEFRELNSSEARRYSVSEKDCKGFKTFWLNKDG